MTTTEDAEDLVEAARTILNLVERVVEKGETFECAVKLIEPILTAAKEMAQMRSEGWKGEELQVKMEGDIAVVTWETEEPPAE